LADLVRFGERYFGEPVSTSEDDIHGLRRCGSTRWIVLRSLGLGGSCGRVEYLGDTGELVVFVIEGDWD